MLTSRLMNRRTFPSSESFIIPNHPNSIASATIGIPESFSDSEDIKTVMEERLAKFCIRKAACLSAWFEEISDSSLNIQLRIEGSLIPTGEPNRQRPGESYHVIGYSTVDGTAGDIKLLRSAMEFLGLGSADPEIRKDQVDRIRKASFAEGFTLPRGIHIDGLKQSRYDTHRSDRKEQLDPEDPEAVSRFMLLS